MNHRPILVAGAGSWGTALAILIARNGHPVLLWGHDAAHIARLSRERCNARHLPGFAFPPPLTPVEELEEALTQARDVIAAVPVAGLRGVLEQIAIHAPADVRISWACKGFERDTLCLPHQIVEQMFSRDCPQAVISGPSFAREVAADVPTAIVVGSRDAGFAGDLVARLHGGRFRTYRSEDVTGIEIGGAVKNVFAIAAGISDGLGFGANSRAALITRGLAEMMRLGEAMGAHRETFMGLAGLGDLVLTCTQDQSRNRRLGLALAAGKDLATALKEINQTVEGVHTADAVEKLAKKHGVEIPIAVEVARILRGETTPQAAVQTLLARGPTSE
ncbi:MAG TPA: NAD(P)H-dependent glycerol-3-phosphate dehydrogenase [Gammaproteobacteria bacterium]|nr:NAD(P)H-dependent glycerol-3-phosphate dehydrogenase [Gammaproteobacteria bacterium]